MKYLYLLIAILFVSNVNAQSNLDGVLDTSFNHSGIVKLGTDTSIETGNLIEVQSDGKIILGGAISPPNTMGIGSLLRFKANGQLDNSFATNGTYLFPHSNNDRIFMSKFIVAPDDKILFAGGTQQGWPVLGRLHPNGTVDNTFATNGIYTQNVTNVVANALGGSFNSIAIQDDGKIVVGGIVSTNINQVYMWDFVLIRLTTNGTLDNSFGNNGIVYLNNPMCDKMGAITMQGDKILLAGTVTTTTGSTDGKFHIARFNNNGSADNTFGTNGSVEYSFNGNDICWAVKTHSGGRIYVSGQSNMSANSLQCFDGIIVCLSTNGNLDNTFSGDGIFRSNTVDSLSLFNTIIIQPDDKIIVGANINNTVYRFNTNGAPDPAFGNNGRVSTLINQSYNASRSMAIQPDGKLIMGGSYWSYQAPAQDQGNWDFCLLRYNCPGCIDQTSAVINSPENNSGLNIYPNPSNGNFTLALHSPATTSGTLQLVNTLGSIVYQQKLALSTGDNSIAIQPNNLAQGVYFAKISTLAGSYIHKLIIRGE